MKYLKSNKSKEFLANNQVLKLDERIDPMISVLYEIHFKDEIDFIALVGGRVFQTQLVKYMQTLYDITNRQAEVMISNMVYYKLLRVKKGVIQNANILELTGMVSGLFFTKLSPENMANLKKSTFKAEYFIKRGDVELNVKFKERVEDDEFKTFMEVNNVYFQFLDRKDNVLHFYFDILAFQDLKGEKINTLILKLKEYLKGTGEAFQLHLRILFPNSEEKNYSEKSYQKQYFQELKDVDFENLNSDLYFSYSKYVNNNKPLNEKFKVVKSYDTEKMIVSEDDKTDDLI